MARPKRRSARTPPASTRFEARQVEAPAVPPSSERFRALDRYRVDREWRRYEGTAQRRLWRELRERFLERHVTTASWALDLGSGPGRFTPWAGGPDARPIALDLSREMLRAVPTYWRARRLPGPLPERVRADATHPPFLRAAFGEVLALGNAIGFAEGSSDRLLDEAMGLVRPGGTLLLELAPGPGERSRYLTRLPVPSVGHLVRAPVTALLPRIEREGFAPEPPRRSEGSAFRRVSAADLKLRLERTGWAVTEVVAVAPALGSNAPRIRACAEDPKAWGHLLQLEETLGRRSERWGRAAAVLLAAVHDPVNRTD